MTATEIVPGAERLPGCDRDEPLTIEVDDLTKAYGGRTVVDGLSFTVRPGRVTGFLGPNGSGKSTTMKVLLGLAAADAGRATIGGRAYRDLPDPAGTVGAVLEPDAFHPGRSGRDHLLVCCAAAGVPRQRVDEVLELVGLDAGAADRRVGTYSLGMKQRLSLAVALLGDPRVLVLDEPANGLDPRGIRSLRDVLRARAAAGGTVLVSSHLLSEVEHLADDVVVITGGRLVVGGPLRELQRETILVRSPAAPHLAQVLVADGAFVEQRLGDALGVSGLSIERIGELAFEAGAVLHELSVRPGSLEELFLELTDGAEPQRTGPAGGSP